jgi:predicted transcriptional regulator
VFGLLWVWLSVGRYRSRLEIIADVLGVVSGGARKTQIMYQANLSYQLLTRYLRDVLDMGLVRMEDESTYALTRKGADFLLEFKEYHARRVVAEERFSEVEDEKELLMKAFLNAENADAGPKSSRKKGAAEGAD